MKTIVWLAVSTAVAYGVIVISGIRLRRMGRPRNVLLLTLHKLVSLGALVYVGLAVHRVNQAIAPGVGMIALEVITALCFMGAMATGGVLSAGDAHSASTARPLHKLTAALSVLGMAAVLYLLSRGA